MAKSRVDKLCEATADFWDKYLEKNPVKPMDILICLERFRFAITEKTLEECEKFRQELRKL